MNVLQGLPFTGENVYLQIDNEPGTCLRAFSLCALSRTSKRVLYSLFQHTHTHSPSNDILSLCILLFSEFRPILHLYVVVTMLIHYNSRFIIIVLMLYLLLDLCPEWFCQVAGSPLSYTEVAAEYAHFLNYTINAIRDMNKPFLKVSLGALAPGGNIQVRSLFCLNTK